MKTSTIISEIVKFAISIVFIWFVFTVPHNRFETIVLSSLLIILANVIHTRLSLPRLITASTTMILNSLHEMHPEDIELGKYVSEQVEQSKNKVVESSISAAYYLGFTFIGILKIVFTLFF